MKNEKKRIQETGLAFSMNIRTNNSNLDRHEVSFVEVKMSRKINGESKKKQQMAQKPSFFYVNVTGTGTPPQKNKG